VEYPTSRLAEKGVEGSANTLANNVRDGREDTEDVNEQVNE